MIDQNLIKEILSRYPDKRSAMLPLLWEVQNENGWITPEGVEEVARLTETTLAEVWEVVSFYTMFRREPIGKHLISLCNNLSCSLNNSEMLLDYLCGKLGIDEGETTPDGLFTLETVECLGACSWAPVMMINETLYTHLTKEKIDGILEKYRKL